MGAQPRRLPIEQDSGDDEGESMATHGSNGFLDGESMATHGSNGFLDGEPIAAHGVNVPEYRVFESANGTSILYRVDTEGEDGEGGMQNGSWLAEDQFAYSGTRGRWHIMVLYSFCGCSYAFWITCTDYVLDYRIG